MEERPFRAAQVPEKFAGFSRGGPLCPAPHTVFAFPQSNLFYTLLNLAKSTPRPLAHSMHSPKRCYAAGGNHHDPYQLVSLHPIH